MIHNDPELAELIYVGDPMCSWCWGFAPTLDKLRASYGPRLPLRILVGGLRPGAAARPLDDELRGYLRSHWQRVHDLSGQPFDSRLLQRRDWLYDTELACKAVVAMRRLLPDKLFPFFTHLQRAFYQLSIDLTSYEVYPELVAPFEVAGDTFLEALRSPELHQETYREFEAVRQLGITGFPSLLLLTGERLQMISRGFASLEQLEGVLATNLSGKSIAG